jgi:hypothetical protein
LPGGALPGDICGIDARTAQPREWPMRYTWVLWSATLTDLNPGSYEFRARTVDLNDFAQPQPRPYLKSGRNEVPFKQIMVT